ncbi:hypothetical protein BPO_1557 [Bergeyella porcorum]|uniref:PDZ domain-containing protein n=1 Tax=Bergeyella porcorum TaxID=1735111 RepID=A0AAU0F0F8_9FLAO
MVFQERTVKSFLTPRVKPIVDTIVTPSTVDAGLKSGDEILSIGGKKITFYDEVPAALASFAGKKATMEVSRNQQIIRLAFLFRQRQNRN